MEQNRYASNNKLITDALTENQNMIKRGYKPSDDQEKITMPYGIVRYQSDVTRKYHLNEIVKDKATKDNIRFAFQLYDFYTFIFTNVKMSKSLEIMLYKQDTINLVSIMEAVVQEAANNYHDHCMLCDKKATCCNFIKGSDAANMKKAVARMIEIGILDLPDDYKYEVNYYYDDRSHVHLRASQESELELQEFDEGLREEVVDVVETIINNLNFPHQKWA